MRTPFGALHLVGQKEGDATQKRPPMSAQYNPHDIEPKWQAHWAASDTYKVEIDQDRPKYYVLDMFPYPSGSGLHVGHVLGYTATDIISRYKRLKGFNVLHPMGWDAFGLPAEQYAIKTGTHPAETTARNIATFKAQLQALGFGYDWSREISTADPAYYTWTQWLFLKLYERGLAYVADVPVNWCPALGTVLANEEVIDGRSEVGGFPVVRRPMKQWMLRITAYADRLLEDLDTLSWPEHLKEMQRNWIGKSQGAEVDFALDPDSTGGIRGNIRVFTTRPDTLFGATYMVLAPEHPLVETIVSPGQKDAVTQYIDQASTKSELQRTDLAKGKTGEFTGAYAINPVNQARIPIWVADYVLASYGTGAIMAVPAHDQRDWEFAKAFDLPILEVISGSQDIQQAAHTGDGLAVNSGFLDGTGVKEAKAAAIAWLEAQGSGKGTVNYKLRDWLFSRQRYWGEPFPLVQREDGTYEPLPEEHLPLTLPDLEDFKPSETGEPPLSKATDWVKTSAPSDGTAAMRETNTMPQWAGSCWYYLRFTDPKNTEQPWSPEKESYWMPVDLYVGGAEHAVLHLLYSRFWHKVLFDCGLVSTLEPFERVVNQGMILGKTYRHYLTEAGEAVSFRDRQAHDHLQGDDVHPDHIKRIPTHLVRWQDATPMLAGTQIELEEVVEKMSKSVGNVINPDEVIKEYGADALRLYEMFMGPLEQSKPWEQRSVTGVYRFLTRIWRLLASETDQGVSAQVRDMPMTTEVKKELHRTIKRVSEDTESMRYNTAIAAMMEYVNFLYKQPEVPSQASLPLVVMLSPYAPHIAEELWWRFDQPGSVTQALWPEWDEAILVEHEVEIGVQIMGKTRGTLVVPADATQDQAAALAKADPAIASHLLGKTIRRVIYVPGRILNFVAT